MANIRLNTITGTPPFEVYISDINGNNQSLVGIVLNNDGTSNVTVGGTLFNTIPAKD